MDSEPTIEKPSSSAAPSDTTMTLQKAVDMGEYDPEYLGRFPEWAMISRHVKLQFITTGIDNRRRQLLRRMATIYNTLDYSEKPQMKVAADRIMDEVKHLDQERERLIIEYSE